MGSTGSGNLSDYPGSGSKSGNGGGSSGSDRCQEAFSCAIEDLEQYDYFAKYSSVPKSGTVLYLQLKKRLVCLTEEGLIVGAIPTRYNYYAACIKDEFNYIGIVNTSSSGSILQVIADFKPATE